jgi:hypothetical protein
MPERSDPSRLPRPLNSLTVALIERWSISDDVERDQAMQTASDEELQELIATFTPEMFRAFNAFLDTKPPEMDWLLWVGLAASEASIDLDRRHRGTAST